MEKDGKILSIPFVVVIFIFILIITGIVLFLNKEYTVYFYKNEGAAVESQIVRRNRKAQEPEKPVREGYNFIGWYYINKEDEKFDFNSKIKKDIYLIAKWEIAEIEKKITTINIISDRNELKVNEEIVLNAEILPNDAITENTKILWKSSDETIATVDENGKVSALKSGIVTIYASVDDIKANFELNIKEIEKTKTETQTENKTKTDNKTKINTTNKVNTNTNTPAPEPTPTPTPTPEPITYSYKWEKIDASVIGEYYLYIVSSRGEKVSGTATVTSTSGKSETVSIPSSGKKYIKNAVASVSNVKANKK